MTKLDFAGQVLVSCTGLRGTNEKFIIVAFAGLVIPLVADIVLFCFYFICVFLYLIVLLFVRVQIFFKIVELSYNYKDLCIIGLHGSKRNQI